MVNFWGAPRAIDGLEHSRRDSANQEPVGRKACAIRPAHGDEKSPRTSPDACARAGLLDGLERYDEGEPIYRWALPIYEHELGPWDFEVAVALHNVGIARIASGDAPKANALLVMAHIIRRQLCSENHPETSLGRREFKCLSAG